MWSWGDPQIRITDLQYTTITVIFFFPQSFRIYFKKYNSLKSLNTSDNTLAIHDTIRDTILSIDLK